MEGEGFSAVGKGHGTHARGVKYFEEVHARGDHAYAFWLCGIQPEREAGPEKEDGEEGEGEEEEVAPAEGVDCEEGGEGEEPV